MHSIQNDIHKYKKDAHGLAQLHLGFAGDIIQAKSPQFHLVAHTVGPVQFLITVGAIYTVL